jgi:hypothetical protein
MELVTLVTACSLAIDPKLVHALIWHQSGGEPWTIAVEREPSPRVYPSMRDAIREARLISGGNAVRVGLAGLPVPASKVAPSVLLPCRNVAMAAVQIAKHGSRCRAHPHLKSDPTFCAVAVYRGSWDHPDVKFATEVAASVGKGDAPNFDMPPNTSTEIFDLADEQQSDTDPTVVDDTPAFGERLKSWASALFPSSPILRKANRSAAPPSPRSQPLHRWQYHPGQLFLSERLGTASYSFAARPVSLRSDVYRRASSGSEDGRR